MGDLNEEYDLVVVGTGALQLPHLALIALEFHADVDRID